MNVIYHLTTERDFFEQIKEEEFTSPSLAAEGFIHFSQEHQILGVANNFYKNAESPILLVVDVDKLTAELKFEPPVHPGGIQPKAGTISEADLFPHLYGKLNKTAITNIIPMRRDDEGNYIRVW